MVPLATACSAMLGLTGQIGGVFLVVGSGLEWMMIYRGVRHFFPLALIGIFPLVGLALFGGATIRGARQVVLLRYGAVADARRLGKRTTGMYVNGRPVVRMEYEFVASDGRPYRGVARTASPQSVGDDRLEPVLYLPSNPRVSLLLDALPGAHPLDVNDDGQWVSYEGMGPVVWLAVIWTCIALVISYASLRLLGVA